MSFYSGKPFAELQNQESVTEGEGENQREESTAPATFALAAGYRGCAGHRCPQGTRGVNLTTPWNMDAQRSMTDGRVMDIASHCPLPQQGLVLPACCLEVNGCVIFQNATAITQPLTVVGACFWVQGLPGLAMLYWQPWSCHISLGAPFTIPGLLAPINLLRLYSGGDDSTSSQSCLHPVSWNRVAH